MFTPREIRDTEFERVSRGYKVEDVDGFLARLADQIDRLMAEKSESDQKLILLAEKVEQYRQEEDALRSALISAERMKESILAEATQQQEILLRDAQQKAERIVNEAEGKIDREEVTLKALKQQVAAFKSEVLNIYKSHLEILSDLPDEPSEANYGESAIADIPIRAVETQRQAVEVVIPEPTAVPMPQPHIAPAPPAVPPQVFVSELEPAINSYSESATAAVNSYDGFAPRAEEQPTPMAMPMYAAPEPVTQMQAPEPASAATESVFASFAAAPEASKPTVEIAAEEESRFGKLDFGENFSFGRD